MSLKSGHTIETVTGRTKELCDLFTGRIETVRLQPGDWTLSRAIEKYGDKYYEFKLFEDDVFVSSMPKGGTTWMQEIVWTLRNNLSLKESDDTDLIARSPILEEDFMYEHLHKPKALEKFVTERCPNYDVNQGVYFKATEIVPKPRTVKSHLSLSFLPPNLLDTAKMVYVIRDPRDVCMSQLHHCRLYSYHNFVGTQDQFVDAFTENAVFRGPYWSHVREAWEKRNHPNMHIVFYEKLKKNPFEEYKRLAEFLGVNATDEQIEKIVHFTSFDEMKKRDKHMYIKEDVSDFTNTHILEKDGGFFRKGKSGGWKNSLTEEQKKKFEVWIEKHCPDHEILQNTNGEN